MPTPTAADRLLRAARGGDAKSQAAVLRQWQDRWFHLALGHLGSVTAARDAVRETALRTLLTLAEWQPPTDAAEPGELAADVWLLRTAADVLQRAADGFPHLDRARGLFPAALPPYPAAVDEAAAALAPWIGPAQGVGRLLVIFRGLEAYPAAVAAAAVRLSPADARRQLRSAVAALGTRPKPRPTARQARQWFDAGTYPGDLRAELFRKRKPSWLLPVALVGIAVSGVLVTVGNRFRGPTTAPATTPATAPATSP